MVNLIPDGVDVHTARLSVAYIIAYDALKSAQELNLAGVAAEVQAAKLTNLILKVYEALESGTALPLPEK